MSTFVSVGTCHQSLARLLDQVALLAERHALPEPVYVQHGHTPFASASCVATAFTTREEFDMRMADADVVIVHGGATVLQSIRAGKVPCVMPRRVTHGEHFDDHQAEFARTLAAQNRIVAVWEAADLEACVQKALQMQRDGRSRPDTTQPPVLLTLVGKTLSEWNQQLSRRDRSLTVAAP